MNTDYLIIGQGLCGTWLSYYLMRAGASVIVVDGGGEPLSASNAASGIINSVTGRRLARQWMGETILPIARTAYEQIGAELGVTLSSELGIHTFFSSTEEAQLFERKAAVDTEFLHYQSTPGQADLFNAHYGSGTIYPALLVDVRALLEAWRFRLLQDGVLVEERVNWDRVLPDEQGVSYGAIRAKAVIDCSGAASAGSPWFERLPFALNKGEVLIADIPLLKPDAIYKYAHLSIVPWTAGRFWIGSTFDWDFTDVLPTASFREKAEAILRQWLRVPYELLEHFAAIRPATVTRDAFSGLHPQQPSIGILNGTGSKGCALAPFLAQNLADHLVQGAPLIPQADVARYARVLS